MGIERNIETKPEARWRLEHVVSIETSLKLKTKKKGETEKETLILFFSSISVEGKKNGGGERRAQTVDATEVI